MVYRKGITSDGIEFSHQLVLNSDFSELQLGNKTGTNETQGPHSQHCDS